jgi:hypothetical protein
MSDELDRPEEQRSQGLGWLLAPASEIRPIAGASDAEESIQEQLRAVERRMRELQRAIEGEEGVIVGRPCDVLESCGRMRGNCPNLKHCTDYQ